MKISLNREEVEQAILKHVKRLVSEQYSVKEVSNLPYGDVTVELEIPETNKAFAWAEINDKAAESVGLKSIE